VKRRLDATANASSRERMLYLHCTMMLAQFEDDMPAVERKCATLIDEYPDSDPYLVGTYYTSLLYAEREQFTLRNARRLDVLARDYFRRSGSRFVIVWHQSIAGPTKFLAGDTAGAIEALQDGFDAAITIGGRESPLASIPALLLAEVHYERNELEAANALVSVHLGLAGELGFVDQLVAGYLTYSRLERHAGDFAEAERILERGLELAHSRGFHRLVNAIVAEQIAQAIARGRIADALRIGNAYDVPADPDRLLPRAGTTTGTQARAVACVTLAHAQGRTADALTVAKRWLQFTQGAGAVRAAISWAPIVAQLLHSSGDVRGAERLMRRAIAAAAPGRFMRTFLDLGRLLPVLAGDATPVDGESTDAAAAFLHELLALAQGYPVAPEPNGTAAPAQITAPVEQLNARELEIVKLVAAGMSNREIGERLALSEGTVKWHAHRVFDKLGVQRRTQAVQVARRMGFIA
jgi:LuxR family maltose regulon positive regulatory protein